MIPVRVTTVSLSKVGFVVLLNSEADPRTLPIFIGIPEAQAIAVQLRGLQPPRPLTHDLFKTVMERLGGDLRRVEIYKLEDGVFYAHLVLHTDSGEIKIDARPSDAIALALRCSALILAARELFEEAGVVVAAEQEAPSEDGAESAPETSLPEGLFGGGGGLGETPADELARLQAELDAAIRDERYEDAARLRDEIRRRSEGLPPNHN